MAVLVTKRARIELLVVSLLAFITTLSFWLTDWDIRLAALFYHPETPQDPWSLQHAWLLKQLFDYAFGFTIVAAVLALLVYALSFKLPALRRWRRQVLYVVLVIAIGPGLLVNLVLKDHWGRPRPVHIAEFGGELQYIPPVKIGHTQDKSFVCGHCSVGYSFVVLYFLAQQYQLLYLLLAVSLGWLMGFTRMSAGGHFVSDILWSGYVVFLVAFALYYGWFVREPLANHDS